MKLVKDERGCINEAEERSIGRNKKGGGGGRGEESGLTSEDASNGDTKGTKKNKEKKVATSNNFERSRVNPSRAEHNKIRALCHGVTEGQLG